MRWLHTILKAKSTTLDSAIIELIDQRPICVCLADEPSTKELMEAVKKLDNRKALGPDHLRAELLKLGI